MGDLCWRALASFGTQYIFSFPFFRASEVGAGELGQGHEFRHAAVDVGYGCKVKTAESL